MSDHSERERERLQHALSEKRRRKEEIQRQNQLRKELSEKRKRTHEELIYDSDSVFQTPTSRCSSDGSGYAQGPPPSAPPGAPMRMPPPASAAVAIGGPSSHGRQSGGLQPVMVQSRPLEDDGFDANAMPYEDYRKSRDMNSSYRNHAPHPHMLGGAASGWARSSRASMQAVGQAGRSISRASMRAAGQAGRSISRAGGQTFRRAQSTAIQMQEQMAEDNRHMLRNAIRRQEAAKARAEETMGRYQNPRTPRERREMQRLKTFIAEQVLDRMNGHKPWFARIITVLQAIAIAAMIYYGGIESWGMGQTLTVTRVTAFSGTVEQPVERAENPYYGPPVETLVRWGSKWAPCMREDYKTDEAIAVISAREETLGCCVNSDNECGMLTQDLCESVTAAVFLGVGQRCSNHTTLCSTIKTRPCCYGILGQCAIITEDHCDVLNGLWNEEAETCVENKCHFRMCGMGYEYAHWSPSEKNPNQFYRFVTAIFLHVGIIHYVLNALGQYVLVAQVEFVAGFWRTLWMYLISGACGFMISALFSADSLSNGSSAAIYGMLGVETVDLFQTWQLLDRKGSQLFNLIIKLVVFLGIGTLPYIDNFAHVGGFAAGVVAGITLLPYMVFSSLDRCRKILCQLVALIFLITLVIGLLYKFYTDNEIVCDWCHYVNCVPYQDGMCAGAAADSGD